MTPQALHALAMALPGASHVVQWGGSDVYKVGGRIFAIRGLGGGVSFKASDIAYAAMVESGMARPAPYLARAKWLAMEDLDAIDPEDMKGWLASAHSLVAARLTRAQRKTLGLA
ncbi:MAG: MmcQ/YjbR family DNA-binding protein [Phenylobacterium sp.]|uniref:MmcQ/YjbR family DNA-binding protein n=1 Tax=Phenylobacterium sp. TaxID=1871053 RepID=UPI00391D3CC0